MRPFCQIDGCLGRAHGRGWCSKHYQRWWTRGDPLPSEKSARATCAECSLPPRSRYAEHCEMHYGRLRRNGHLDLLSHAPAHITSNGYVVLNGQAMHPLRRPSGPAVLAHRDVLFRTLGSGPHPCHWCRMSLRWDRTYPRDRDGLTVDHLDANTTNNEPDNLVPSCGRCNLLRTRVQPPVGWLTTGDVARLAGLTLGAIHEWRRAGLLAGVRRPEGWLFEVETVRQHLAIRKAARPMADGKRVRLRRVAVRA